MMVGLDLTADGQARLAALLETLLAGRMFGGGGGAPSVWAGGVREAAMISFPLQAVDLPAESDLQIAVAAAERAAGRQRQLTFCLDAEPRDDGYWRFDLSVAASVRIEKPLVNVLPMQVRPRSLVRLAGEVTSDADGTSFRHLALGLSGADPVAAFNDLFGGVLRGVTVRSDGDERMLAMYG